ncbi:MAG: tRNA dihydrouridine synthase DusB, partial [Alphaproteobacteria bacterium]|nr:tRNA dihydrouridine synthase DusB [Alphaproteobacteria bacterium]
MTIQIGPHTLSVPVTLAPMSGITDLPFRRLAEAYGAGLVVSEMIASPEVLRRTTKTRRRIELDRNRNGRPVAVQLVGIEPQIMAEAARFCVDAGAEIIDINFGCPTKKVTKKSSGSAIMRDETLATDIMAAVVDAVEVPVTVKMRLGWDESRRNAPRLARLAEVVGVEMITVHARTRCQMFDGRADWDYLAEVKAAVDIPVIANGDIGCIEDARACLAASGCDGVMVGRAARGRPWLVGEIGRRLSGNETDPGPDWGERRDTVLTHFDGLLSLYG